MKIRMEYAATVALIVAICTMAAAYGLPGGDAPDEESPLFNVRMDQAMEDMGAGIPGIDPNNAWSLGSINEESLATSNELIQIIDDQAVLGQRPTRWRTCRSTCSDTCRPTCVVTCRTCVATCPSTCVATCANTCWGTCPSTCSKTCGVTCSGFTCWRTCGDTCGNKRTCRSTCPDTCRFTCANLPGGCCPNNQLAEIRE